MDNPNFPKSLNEFYKEVDLVKIDWIISNREKGEELKNKLKQDPWLKENYWDEGWDFSMTEERMSGLIQIQKLEDTLNPEFCKDQGYYSVIEHWIDGENPDDYIPFDIHWTITACLKRENGKISDNIWLINMEGRYLINMNVTIEKYLELCYKAKGFYHWQLVYAFQNEDEQDYQLMKRYLPMFFPHLELDLSEFGM
ncbi:hypothetical protein D3C87_86030 [compost metagenome]